MKLYNLFTILSVGLSKTTLSWIYYVTSSYILCHIIIHTMSFHDAICWSIKDYLELNILCHIIIHTMSHHHTYYVFSRCNMLVYRRLPFEKWFKRLPFEKCFKRQIPLNSLPLRGTINFKNQIKNENQIKSYLLNSLPLHPPRPFNTHKCSVRSEKKTKKNKCSVRSEKKQK